MSDQPSLRDDAAVRRLLYLAAFLLVVPPLAQAVTQLWPWALRSIQWRFTAATVLSTALVLPAIGLVLAAAVARAAGQRGGVVTVGVLAVTGVLGLLACTANFVLDALQLREIVSSANMPAFKATAARVLLLCTLFMGAFTGVAVAAFTGRPKRAAAARRSRQRTDDLGLLVAQD